MKLDYNSTGIRLTHTHTHTHTPAGARAGAIWSTSHERVHPVRIYKSYLNGSVTVSSLQQIQPPVLRLAILFL